MGYTEWDKHGVGHPVKRTEWNIHRVGYTRIVTNTEWATHGVGLRVELSRSVLHSGTLTEWSTHRVGYTWGGTKSATHTEWGYIRSGTHKVGHEW